MTDRPIDPIRPEVAAVLDLIDRAASDVRQGWPGAACDALGRAQRLLEELMVQEVRHA